MNGSQSEPAEHAMAPTALLQPIGTVGSAKSRADDRQVQPCAQNPFLTPPNLAIPSGSPVKSTSATRRPER